MRVLCLLTFLPLASAVCAPTIRPEMNATIAAQMPLDEGWQNPPILARTRVWWWWLNGNTDKETITRDLEAMKGNGIGGANIIDAGGDTQEGNQRIQHGPDFGSLEWRELFRHAVVEADRLGLELGFNIQSGWNLGGPKVPVEESSKKATFSLTTAEGGRTLDLQLAQPPSNLDFYQDVAVVAWPAHDNPTPSKKPAPSPAQPKPKTDKKKTGGKPSVADTPEDDIPDLNQKAYFKYPGSFTGTESWHLLECDPAKTGKTTCQPDEVKDLTTMMDATGKLHWEAPPGRWEILRFGYTSSGARVSTHSENGGGLAIDYLDRATFDSYWKQSIEPILNEVKPYLGKSLCFLHTDSWELGPVNWTRRMPEEFQRLRGYDIKPMLPVIAGRIIGSPETSTRFLNDFRRTIADLMTANKYQGFSEHAHAAGLGIHPESGGPHAGPMDALQNLGVSDIPMGEFWSPSPRHRVTDVQRYFVKQTSSAAHIYGKRISLAEAFTNIGRHWQHDPRSLKSTFDRAACEGHNLTMWHTFDSSTKEQGMPGAAYFAGEHFNPNVTWWSQGKAFVSFLNRCHFLLQQGIASNDVLHYYGENIPSFVRLKRDDPAKCLPGYDYDVIDTKALLERTDVDKNGNIVLPDGTSYRILSITPHDAISLPVMRHLADLVEHGATLVGPRPARQYSLSGGKAADTEFNAICDRLWGSGDSGMKPCGKGRVIWGKSSREVLQSNSVPEDFSWQGGDDKTFVDFIHRHTDDTQIYYIANRNDRPENVKLRFRVTGLTPEFWDPITAKHRDATDFSIEGGVTTIPYTMNGEESLFVLFRKPAKKPSGKPNVPTLKPAADIDGPWTVSFDPKWGGPASVVFDKLTDWTQNPDPGIRFYSGSAMYDKTFTAPKVDGPVWLDLGGVESLCEVTLNGENLGVLWSAPFRTDISGKLKPGANHLQVKVVNLWANRIIGDANLPPEKRLTKTNIVKLTKDTPLEPSGLLGPVRLLTTSP